jgi:hydroxypyruvate isomerase
MLCSAHISWLFAERPYLERIAAARAAGFDAIESAWPARRSDRDGLADAVAEERRAAPGFAVTLLNCAAGDARNGERGFVNDDSRREEAEAAFVQAVELAVATGAPQLNLLVGRVLPDVPRARQRAAVVSAVRSFDAVARARGLRVLLEPVNAVDHPGFLAPTPDDAVELIEAAGCDDVGLVLDLYHVARAGVDPASAIERHRERIAHVQISDHPGRGVPGSGTLPLLELLELLAAGGYDGAVGLEYDPRGSTEATLEFMREPRWRALFG